MSSEPLLNRADNTSEGFVYFVRGLWEESPVFRQLLGMCPTLAVTAQMKPALTMGLAVIFVLVCSNLVVSLMRKLLQGHLRLLMFTLTIATFVTIADYLLQAFLPDMSAKLGPYVPLIIVNCIVIGRAEACASRKGLWVSFCDGWGQGLGYTLGLVMMASIREFLADGAIAGYRLVPEDFVGILAMKLPVGAFLTLGILLGLSNHFLRKK